MKLFALVGLLAALSATGVTAENYEREHLGQIPLSTVIFSFTTGGQGSIYDCRPVNSSAAPAPDLGTPNDATSPPIPLPTQAPTPVISETVAPPVPTSGQGSGGSIYVCHPTDDSNVTGNPNNTTSTPIPSSPPTCDERPASSGAGIPHLTSTGGQGSRAPTHICYPVDPSAIPGSYPSTFNNAPLTPTPSAPVPTSTSPASASSPFPGVPLVYERASVVEWIETLTVSGGKVTTIKISSYL